MKMEDTPLSDKADKATFRAFTAVLKQLREIDTEMHVQQMQVLTWIALNEGKTQRELRAALDMAYSTSSRNIAALSKVHRLGKEGLGLIEWLDDPEDRRSKLLQLTPKGRMVVNNIVSTLR